MKPLLKVIFLGLFMAGCLHRPLGMDAERDGGGGSEAVYHYDHDGTFFKTFVELVDDEDTLWDDIANFLAKHSEEVQETYEWDGDEYTPLHYAAERGDLDLVEELVEERNVPVDIKTSQSSITPLQCAAVKAHLKVVRYLVSKGADVQAKDGKGAYVLHYAASGGDVNIVEHLLDQGAKIDVTDRHGFTILHVTARFNKLKLAKYIIGRTDANSILSKKSNIGNTPRDIATHASREMFKILEDAGAKRL